VGKSRAIRRRRISAKIPTLAKTATTHHIRRSEIAHDKLVFSLVENLRHLVRHTVNAHLGFQIVAVHMRYAYEILLEESREKRGSFGKRKKRIGQGEPNGEKGRVDTVEKGRRERRYSRCDFG
jgi:hypothetical protein